MSQSVFKMRKRDNHKSSKNKGSHKQNMGNMKKEHNSMMKDKPKKGY